MDVESDKLNKIIERKSLGDVSVLRMHTLNFFVAMFDYFFTLGVLFSTVCPAFRFA